MEENAVLRLCFRIIFWLLIGVGLAGGQGGRKKMGYCSNSAKGDLWKRADQ